MLVHHNRRGIIDFVADLREKGKSIGFVPTMGALHKGHSSLIDFALQNCDHVVVSIFVNPTQFNNAEDLKTYPRDIDGDLDFLSPYKNSITVFVPDNETVYGKKVEAKNYDFGGLEHEMEGKFRPGHFDGVGTVLKHLFEIIQPDKAFFGEKDYQQLLIVKKLVEIENLPVEIIGCPINRHDDGLAESSRNKRLTAEQRHEAPVIYQHLIQAKEDFDSQSIEHINNQITKAFTNQPDLELEYFTIADAKTLKTAKEKEEGKKYRAFIAVFAGNVRLIDNIALN